MIDEALSDYHATVLQSVSNRTRQVGALLNAIYDELGLPDIEKGTLLSTEGQEVEGQYSASLVTGAAREACCDQRECLKH